ncbi:undecaprenyl-diphosphate phosphatase [Thermoleophilia bacterium SCSIO 60948]|nr:undecaprenyl-diphosphate phosphatase [Thermoleophilia bacterium SCSIO 60948]
MLPISSSAHIRIAGELYGGAWHRLDPALAKTVEVALHTGAGIALAIGQRRRIAGELAALDRRRACVIALSFLPPAIVGLTLEHEIEGRLRGTPALGGGLAAGGLALIVADRAPQRRGPGSAGALDGLLLGVAQAAALVPGVSRGGATLSVARARRFERSEAHLLSRSVALPVIAGATALKAVRTVRRPPPPGATRALAAGATAAFASTLASGRLLDVLGTDRPLWPYGVYRLGLAAALLARSRRAASGRRIAGI